MFKKITPTFFQFLVWLAYGIYRVEGINALLLIMPSKLIVPTLRKYGARIGENVILHSPLMIHNAGENYSNLVIGNNVYFGRAVFLDLKDQIKIGDRVTLSMKTTLLTQVVCPWKQTASLPVASWVARKLRASSAVWSSGFRRRMDSTV